MKRRRGLLCMALLASACANPPPISRPIPPPDPIMPDDAVKNAETAANVANTCYFIAKSSWGKFTARDARLIADQWWFVHGGGISMLEVKVSKRTGQLTDCTDIEQ